MSRRCSRMTCPHMCKHLVRFSRQAGPLISSRLTVFCVQPHHTHLGSNGIFVPSVWHLQGLSLRPVLSSRLRSISTGVILVSGRLGLYESAI
ncbi:hypothetical protein SLA2020_153140 [Shorea laevis]